MRKLFSIWFIAVISLASLVSCGNAASDNEVISRDELVGTWASAFFYNEKIDGYVPLMDAEQLMVSKFKDNGTCYIGIGASGDTAVEIDWSLRKNIVTLKNGKGRMTMEVIKYDGEWLEVELRGLPKAKDLRCRLANMD